MTALLLLSFALLAGFVAPGALRRARWVYQAPLLGIVAWYAVLVATTTAVAAAIASLLVPGRWAEAPACLAWRWCLQAVRGEHGVLGQLTAVAVVAVTTLLAVRLVGSAVRLVRGLVRQRREHLRLLRLTGSERPELGAVVVPSPEAAAYMLAGRHRRVVVTTGAIACLSREELVAVLAHERAHAAGRHDVLVNAVRLLHDAFPALPLFAVATQQLVRLVEMRADEVAARQHRPLSLARALVAMADAGGADVPAGAVPAAGGDAVARLNRLLDPPERLSFLRRFLIGGCALAVVMMPIMVLFASWFVSAQALCLLLPT